MFENDVEMYGAQTNNQLLNMHPSFENDVEMYGAQTIRHWQTESAGLRMMQKCMVLKQMKVGQIDTYEFENDVEMYGAQTY